MSVLVVGAGGHAKVVIATLRALEIDIAGCLDDDPDRVGQTVLGVTVLGPIERVNTHGGQVVLGIGDNAVRRQLVDEYLDVEWISVVHPAATVHDSVELGHGTVVFAGAVLQPDVQVGRHAIVNTSSSIDHDCRVGDFAHLAPGVHLSGGVTIEEGGFLGVGSCAVPGTTIGAWGVVGAGAIVIHDLPPNVTSVGMPARPRDRS